MGTLAETQEQITKELRRALCRRACAVAAAAAARPACCLRPRCGGVRCCGLLTPSPPGPPQNRYQSSLDLSEQTYAIIRHLPLARDLVFRCVWVRVRARAALQLSLPPPPPPLEAPARRPSFAPPASTPSPFCNTHTHARALQRAPGAGHAPGRVLRDCAGALPAGAGRGAPWALLHR